MVYTRNSNYINSALSATKIHTTKECKFSVKSTPKDKQRPQCLTNITRPLQIFRLDKTKLGLLQTLLVVKNTI